MPNVTDTRILIYCLIASAAALLLLIGWIVLYKFLLRRRGVDGTRKVAGFLKRFSSIRSFRVLNNLSLPLRGEVCAIDHILIGFFGIMVVTTKNCPGIVYGGGKDKQWSHVVTKKNKNEKKTYFENPIRQNQKNVEAVREALTSRGIYKTSIESVTVFTRKNAQLSIEKGLPVYKFPAFKKLIRKSKYSEDGPADVEQIAKALLEAAL